MLSSLTAETGVLLAQSGDWLSSTWSIVLLVLGFSLVIFVHELGHFAAAKWAGVRVEQFAIGFGRALLAYRKGIGWRAGSTYAEYKRRIDEYLGSNEPERPTESGADTGDGDAASSMLRASAADALGLGETEYRFNVLPLGGYVKMLGQEDFVIDKSGELKVKPDPRSFTSKSIGARMVIVSAGVVMNLLFAAAAFAAVVMAGRVLRPAVIGEVMPDSPAARAGLQAGDRIAAINGRETNDFNDLPRAVMFSDVDETLVLDVYRDGKPVEPKPRILPEFNKNEKIRQIGVTSGQTRRVFRATVHPQTDPLPGDLRERDEFHEIVVDGQPRPLRSLGDLRWALQSQRGRPVEVVVRRPKAPTAIPDEDLGKDDLDIETTDVRVRLQAFWQPSPETPGDLSSTSLLGLSPRLTVLSVTPKKSFDEIGMQPGDVIRRLGDVDHPNYAQFLELIKQHSGRPLDVEVQRPFAGNHGLSAQTVRFCVEHREELIAAAREDAAAARARAQVLAEQFGLDDAARDKLRAALDELADASAWRRWLDDVDVHKLPPAFPEPPLSIRSLFGDRPDPTIDAQPLCIDEQQVFVANVLDKVGGRPSPAKAAGIPAGAVIVSAAGEPVRRWYQLSEIFRTHAGESIPLEYRIGDEVTSTTIAVPGCVTAALDLPAGTRIVKIDGRASHAFSLADGQRKEIALPDWRAVRGILGECAGRTVDVEYVTGDGRTITAPYAATEDNADPWLHRVHYTAAFASFACYPMWERHPVRNPIKAVVIGFEEAYNATVMVVQTIRHLIFTRQVGVDKISGPVGILKLGSEAAESGVISLLWFLGLISANLAVINFLPMPIVDGGLFLFLILEKVRGEPVSIKTQIATQLLGIALIATLFILVTYQDILNWIG